MTKRHRPHRPQRPQQPPAHMVMPDRLPDLATRFWCEACGQLIVDLRWLTTPNGHPMSVYMHSPLLSPLVKPSQGWLDAHAVDLPLAVCMDCGGEP